jgi:hypothetical protein
MSYHKADRDKYVTRRMNLAGETIKSLTKYFQNDLIRKRPTALSNARRWIVSATVLNGVWWRINAGVTLT